ncbi:MAG: ABC transporter substrate-binding protein [Moorea sp. SIO1G6]|uniref:ABC transporter substrate-binding protein n=1 Tax=Moorena sp. SIO1G6 TaxID=2607840 RepID=UPI0013C143B5|nr:ABC transporter substrate-binding protein [Moorena sp. SIO1G6]NET63707.1 ABC transporter substrate-binding protein [Moorena sp. SIO1G6]
MYQNNETKLLGLSLMISLALVSGCLWWFKVTTSPLSMLVSKNTSSEKATIPNYLSRGDHILFSDSTTLEKQLGVEAVTAVNYDEAVVKFTESLDLHRDDPEALIYLNNARIGEKPYYTIAAVVSISDDINTAKDILRGVAQAQQEINQAGGIKGIPVKVLIANDDNNPEVAKKLALKLVSKPEILAVVGNFNSKVTQATADSYESGQLVTISPISTSVNLSGISNFVFRTVPNDFLAGRALAKHMVQDLKQHNVAVFYNSQSESSQSLKSEFVTAVFLKGGRVVSDFDVSEKNFSAAKSFKQAIHRGAQALMLGADSSTQHQVLNVVQLNSKHRNSLGQQLVILAGNQVYNTKTLTVAGKDAEGMVVALPWHPLAKPGSEFPKTADQLWGIDVNWRTAMAYDAVQALSAAIRHNPTRSGVQQELSAPNFFARGAAAPIRFFPSGDRYQPVNLVTIEPSNSSSLEYEFVPIP